MQEQAVSQRGTDTSAAYGNAYYLSATRYELLRVRVSEVGKCISDVCRVSYSSDDGQTWSDDAPTR